MRARLLVSLVAAIAWSCGTGVEPVAGFAMPVAIDHPVAVVVELFTSEGCSSCPPADDELANLVRQQPIPNVTIIGLGEHVDYWDNLGWRDVFSAPTFTVRQSDYERVVFRSGSVYTPQAVVDGRVQVVGSDSAALRRAIANAAGATKAAVTIKPQSSTGTNLTAQFDVVLPSTLSSTHPLDVVAVVAERNLATRVQRGENGGRFLKHGVVARQFVAVGTLKAGEGSFSKTIALSLDAAWKRPDLQLVGLVQDRTTKAIVGAAVEELKAVASN